jgi:nicotinate-nucleotide adenylyltransferase
MGADNLQQIPRWRRWPEIFGLAPVAIFRRAGYASGRGQGKAANRFNDAWHSLRYSKKLAEMTPPAWLVLDNPLNLLSGTAIRERGENSRGQNSEKSKARA